MNQSIESMSSMVYGLSPLNRRLPGFVVTVAITLAMLLVASGCGPESDASGETPETWEVEGPLLAWEGGLWIIDATPIVVPSELGMDERRWLGAIVTASGSFDETGERIAERVSVVEGMLPNSTLPAATVSGPIEEIDDDLWVISGSDVVVPESTYIDGGDGADVARELVETGTLATIEGYQLADGRVLAVSVVLRQAVSTDAPVIEPAAEPESTPTPLLEPAPAAPDIDTDDNEVDPTTDDDDGDSDDDGDDDDGNGKPDKDDEDKPGKPDNGKHKGQDKEGSRFPAVPANDGMLAG